MKKLFALLLALMLVLGLCACGGNETETEPSESVDATTTTGFVDPLDEEPPVDDGFMKFTVTVVHGDGKEQIFEYSTPDSGLGGVLLENGLIQGNDGPYGLEITEVDGEKAVYNEDKAYWAIYIGDEYATSGIDGISIYDGAEFKLVYTRE